MDFFAVIRIIFRRWHVVLSSLILTLAAAFAVMQSVAPSYQARGSALIIAPSPAISDVAVNPMSLNPFARFDASTSILGSVAVEIMNDVNARERVAALGANSDYQIGQSPTSPVLSVVVIDTDEQQAIRSASLVLAAVNDELDRRQAEAGAPEESRIRALVVTEPSSATKLVGARVRAFTAVAVLGLAASVSLAFITEAFLLSRRRRRAAADDLLGPTGVDEWLQQQPRDDRIQDETFGPDLGSRVPEPAQQR